MSDGNRIQRLRGWLAAGEYRSKSGGCPYSRKNL
jgi:hypothetical protein